MQLAWNLATDLNMLSSTFNNMLVSMPPISRGRLNRSTVNIHMAGRDREQPGRLDP
jgi:hypothetical protein